MPEHQSDTLLSAKQMLSISGALWAVFGVVVFMFVKDVALAERAKPISPKVLKPAMRVLLGFFAVNFGTILVVQSYGCWLLPDRAKPVAFTGHFVSLALYIFMALQTSKASTAALAENRPA